MKQIRKAGRCGQPARLDRDSMWVPPNYGSRRCGYPKQRPSDMPRRVSSLAVGHAYDVHPSPDVVKTIITVHTVKEKTLVMRY